MKYTIGIIQKAEVCRQAFRLCYFMKKDYLTKLCERIKLGYCHPCHGEFNDKTGGLILSAKERSYFERQATNMGLELSAQQLAAASIPNTSVNIAAYGWMKEYFEMIGDSQPNLPGVIHLGPCTIVSVYEQYVAEMKLRNFTEDHILNPESFGRLWLNCFP